MIVFRDESYAIVGACFEVYNHLGAGFLEGVYQECVELELGAAAIPFVAQERLQLTYKDHALRSTFHPDLICYDRIIVEIKAVSSLGDHHRAQVHNYLKATGIRLGLLFNFGHPRQLERERIVR